MPSRDRLAVAPCRSACTRRPRSPCHYPPQGFAPASAPHHTGFLLRAIRCTPLYAGHCLCAEPLFPQHVTYPARKVLGSHVLSSPNITSSFTSFVKPPSGRRGGEFGENPRRPGGPLALRPPYFFPSVLYWTVCRSVARSPDPPNQDARYSAVKPRQNGHQTPQSPLRCYSPSYFPSESLYDGASGGWHWAIDQESRIVSARTS